MSLEKAAVSRREGLQALRGFADHGDEALDALSGQIDQVVIFNQAIMTTTNFKIDAVTSVNAGLHGPALRIERVPVRLCVRNSGRNP
jgi:hypothetical protein